MRKISRLPRFKNIPITRKLYFVVITMALLIAAELFILWFAIHTLSSVRALVGAEGLWSKAQKDAVYHLRKYYRTHDEKDYLAFHQFMAVPLGDHKTRLELLKPIPDMDVARQGFLEGRVHPDDIDGMIKLLRQFHDISYIKQAIAHWTAGDSIIAELVPIGEKLHREITSEYPVKEIADRIIAEVDPINQRLTTLEDNFSFTLGEGSRWLENLILKLLFLVAISVEITGLTLTISISRAIAKGLREINRAAKKIAGGDLNDRATVFSKDEIGQVAVAINRMTSQLVVSNHELEQVVYIASHDLQEPLHTITNFIGLLQKDLKGQLNEDTSSHLKFIVQACTRMEHLIQALLDHSRIGKDKKLEEVDCNELLKNVLEDLAASIKNSNAQIKVEKLPVINGYRLELNLLFQNLISNAIKYRKKDVAPEIEITSVREQEHWKFVVKDNGIGIEKKYYEKIFLIFQRLHSKNKYEGTGIGLSHCKKIVELHDGEIWVESTPGIGSNFYFTIKIT